MKTDDLDPVIQIWLESNRQAHSFIEADYWEKNKEEVRKMLPHSLIQVAEIEGNIVGFIGMNETKIEGLFELQLSIKRDWTFFDWMGKDKKRSVDAERISKESESLEILS